MELAIVDGSLPPVREGFAFDYLNDPGVQPKFQGLTRIKDVGWYVFGARGSNI